MQSGRTKNAQAFKAKVAKEAITGHETVANFTARYEVHPG